MNYTTTLNIVFGAIGLVLVMIFFRTGGPRMIRAMKGGGAHPAN
ncbi:hypothetical protein N0A02_33490 (plasmid) [Paraburkholderia acidicola]|uniref:Phospho-N-acetylmuramoyl-pentapeptide-transferase n=1 Tax=Paraburkholderia acidicola TaxID=1912599 RepID=A0ABV1LYK3_9BURK